MLSFQTQGAFMSARINIPPGHLQNIVLHPVPTSRCYLLRNLDHRQGNFRANTHFPVLTRLYDVAFFFIIIHGCEKFVQIERGGVPRGPRGRLLLHAAVDSRNCRERIIWETDHAFSRPQVFCFIRNRLRHHGPVASDPFFSERAQPFFSPSDTKSFCALTFVYEFGGVKIEWPRRHKILPGIRSLASEHARQKKCPFCRVWIASHEAAETFE
jgi:hypothetical protein